MSITGIVRQLFARRWRELEKHKDKAEELQFKVLSYLLNRAKETEYGRYHHFADIKSY